MSSTNLPVWYPLQAPPIKQFKPTLADIEELIEKRVAIYKSPEQDFDFSRHRFEEDDEYFERISIDRKSFGVMKMGVALDLKLSNWFTEFEGDLFQYRFENALWETKVRILNELFPVDKFGKSWMELEELERYLKEPVGQIFSIRKESSRIEAIKKRPFGKSFEGAEYGMQKMVAVNFRYAGFHLKKRDPRVRLYKGWVILSVDQCSTTIKHRFEDLLRIELDEFIERIETEGSGEIKRLPGEINAIVRKLLPKRRNTIEISSVDLEGNLEDNHIIFPLCIQDLLRQVEETGYLPHMERFQLGLFLKHIGMEVEEQMEYWFTKAVDNLNISYEEFKGKAGYIIRHLYGLEGGKIDYDMPSCETIQTKMYCTFRHQEIEGINERIQQFNSTLPGQEQIIRLPIAKETSDLAANGFANEACGKFLQLTTGAMPRKIYHPLSYLKFSGLATGKLKPDEIDEEDEAEEGGDEHE